MASVTAGTTDRAVTTAGVTYRSRPVYSSAKSNHATGMTTTPIHWTSYQSVFAPRDVASSSKTRNVVHQTWPKSSNESHVAPASGRSRHARIDPAVPVTTAASSAMESGLNPTTSLLHMS